MAAVGRLCDGFEGGDVGAGDSIWKKELAGGSTAVVDATKAYRGAKSVHLTTGSDQAFVTETATFNQAGSAATNNEMWGRMFVWFQMKPGATAPQSHVVFLRLEDPTNKASAQLHLAGGSRGTLSAEIRYNNGDHYQPAMGTSDPAAVKYPSPMPAWQCWEWHTTAENTIEFFVNGKPYSLMTVKAADNWPFPVFKKLYVGFLQFSNTPAADMWVDEVALDNSARIGCDN